LCLVLCDEFITANCKHIKTHTLTHTGVEWLLLHLGDQPQQLAVAAAAAAVPIPVIDIASDLNHLLEAQNVLRAPQVHSSIYRQSTRVV